MKEPKDLGLKIGSPAEVLWTNVKENLKKQIELEENTLLVNKEFLKLAEKRRAEEQERSKPLNKAE